MKTYVYKAFDAGGRRVRGFVEADGLKDARERLAARGWLPETLTPADAVRGRRASRWRRVDARATVYRELAALLKAGLPLSQAIELLIDAPETAPLRSVLSGARDRIREGASPAEAFEFTGALSPFESAALRAGQRAGAMDDAFQRLAAFLEDQVRIRSRVRSALVYPVFVGVVALVLAIGMLGFMLPAFAAIFEEARVPLPPLTRAVLAAGSVAAAYGLPAVAAALAAAWALRRRMRSSAAFRSKVERGLARFGPVGRPWRALAGMRFARTMSMLLRGGVPLLEAIRMAARATGSAWIEAEIAREAETIRHGGRMADSIRRVEPLGASLSSWTRAGEAGGDLSGMLDLGATRCEDVWERALTRSMALLEPLLILTLGALVFVLALAILMPILSLNRGMG